MLIIALLNRCDRETEAVIRVSITHTIEPIFRYRLFD